jgi:hypothetical protein
VCVYMRLYTDINSQTCTYIQAYKRRKSVSGSHSAVSYTLIQPCHHSAVSYTLLDHIQPCHILFWVTFSRVIYSHSAVSSFSRVIYSHSAVSSFSRVIYSLRSLHAPLDHAHIHMPSQTCNIYTYIHIHYTCALTHAHACKIYTYTLIHAYKSIYIYIYIIHTYIHTYKRYIYIYIYIYIIHTYIHTYIQKHVLDDINACSLSL